MLRRFIVIAAIFCMLGGPSAAIAQTVTGKLTADQYKKALWLATRFYGAQRDGVGPNWLLMDHTYKTSFLKDGQSEGVDLTGGWFDCGDNVLFGHTFFYSAYMLAKAYETFPTGFHDLYNGGAKTSDWTESYSDYAASAASGNDCKDWNIGCGKPNGIPDLLEELKYATDWIIKATPSDSTFYYQKGNGGAGDDHKLWVTSGYKATLNRADGGEKDTPRPITKNPNGPGKASYAAAALAVMARIYEKYDPAYAALCRTHAKNAYDYAKSKKGGPGGKTGNECCYGAFSSNKSDIMLRIAAGEMYKTTGTSTYLTDMGTSQVNFHDWGFDYANPHDLAVYILATVSTQNAQSHLTDMKTKFVDTYTGRVNSEGVNTNGNEWGAMRYVANHAFTAALYSKAANTAQYDQFIYNQIDFILGKNSRNYSFLVGFNDHGGQAAQKPHHRNVFLNDENVTVKNTLNIPLRNTYFGYMVGGHRVPGNYEDNVDKYESTEGGLDYQVGFVGALAYIISKLAPADTSKFGIDEPPPPPAVPATLRISTSINAGDTSAFVKDTLFMSAQSESVTHLYAYIFDEHGNIMDIPCDSVYWTYSNGGAVPIPPGCIFPLGSGFSGDPAVISASYRLGGAIRDSVVIAAEEVSVRHKVSSMAKNGYSITVRPNAVLFAVPDGRSITKVSVHDLRGRRVFNRTGNESQVTWNSGRQSKGMYVVRMSMDNGVVVQRNLMLK
ncbi:MAG: glycoside hydrolase family 9 protein [Chitinispirillia bacterium]|nr:glycoside hydrolase family 9 protein [Chitinispirillia bacterium]MCL2241257.1 glycoside hydrolase family 9 protein [Chitinispirillia bacterium]